MTALALTTGKRKIKDGSKFNKLFPPENAAYGNYAMLKKDGTVFDTVKKIAEIIKKDAKDTATIAPLLKGKSRYETVKNIHRFMVNYLQYDTESGEKLRSPRRTWWVGQKQYDKDTGDTGVDCDDLVIFSGSILYNLKIPFYIRIVKISSQNFQHVYLVVPISGETLQGTYITLDGVLSDFNYEYPFQQQKTFDMNGLPIEYLGALGNADVPPKKQKKEDVLYQFLKTLYDKLVNGTVVPTKINLNDLLKLLKLLLDNWSNDEKRLQALQLAAKAEKQFLSGKHFFNKLLEVSTARPVNKRLSLAGGGFDDPDIEDSDWNVDDSNIPDWEPPGGNNNNTGNGGGNWANVLTSMFDALANFDWGLISNNNQPPTPSPNPNMPPYPYDPNRQTKQQIAGMSFSTIGGILLVGGLVYVGYRTLIEKKPLLLEKPKTK